MCQVSGALLGRHLRPERAPPQRPQHQADRGAGGAVPGRAAARAQDDGGPVRGCGAAGQGGAQAAGPRHGRPLPLPGQHQLVPGDGGHTHQGEDIV